MEIEAKFRVTDHGPIRERLRQLGATCEGQVLEINHIFDDADRSLLAGQRGLRVRACHAPDGRLVSATMTYKGAPLPTQLKQREEIETQVADPDAARRLFAALGFVEVISFQKRRESWRIGEAHVELDELPELGTFVEIEAARPSDIQDIERLIGTGLVPVSKTYVALVADHCSPRPDGTRHLRL